MEIKKAYKIRQLINERENIRVMIENMVQNDVITLGQELFNLIVDHYKKELSKIDQEIEKL